MSDRSLEDAIRDAGSPVAPARHSQLGPYVYPAVPAEFSNWRDEQIAWRETCALFDQTHHMTDLLINGPDAIRLLSDVGVNTFAGFAPNKAKQFVACNHDGYVIGDAISSYLAENRLSLVGRPSVHNWVQFHAETGDYDVEVERDERTAVNPTGRRRLFRYQVQGPNALEVLRRATGGPLPEIAFFNMGELTIAAHTVRAFHHGMSGAPGMELFGPWGSATRSSQPSSRPEASSACARSARAFTPRTRSSRGGIPCPLPAVFTGDQLKSYREWLPANGRRGHGSWAAAGSTTTSRSTTRSVGPGYGRVRQLRR